VPARAIGLSETPVAGYGDGEKIYRVEIVMRGFAALLPLAVVMATATPAAAQLGGFLGDQDPGFRARADKATHILVVDMSGRVVEVWKGTATPGDRIPIDKFYAPSLPRYRADSGRSPLGFPPFNGYWYDGYYGSPFTSERLILFLVKSDRDDEATQFLGGWLPASDSGWFASSTARVDQFGFVSVQPQPVWGASSGIPDTGRRGSVEAFKRSVMNNVGVGGWYD
jgi:hypothetical protein